MAGKRSKQRGRKKGREGSGGAAHRKPPVKRSAPPPQAPAASADNSRKSEDLIEQFRKMLLATIGPAALKVPPAKG